MLHSVLSWRMGIGFVAELKSNTATPASASQGVSLIGPCSWIPGLHGSFCVSMVLRVQLRFEPSLRINFKAQELLWLHSSL